MKFASHVRDKGVKTPFARDDLGRVTFSSVELPPSVLNPFTATATFYASPRRHLRFDRTKRMLYRLSADSHLVWILIQMSLHRVDDTAVQVLELQILTALRLPCAPSRSHCASSRKGSCSP